MRLRSIGCIALAAFAAGAMGRAQTNNGTANCCVTAGNYPGISTLTPSGGSTSNAAETLAAHVAGAPSITPGGIANASGYQTTLAPGVVFVIFGNNLGPAEIQGTSLPYPPNLSGTSISFTPAAGGAPIPAKLVFTSASVVAGFLPSSALPGTYSVTVTYNSQTSSPQNITVAQRSFGIATANSGGTEEAQATLANVDGGLSLVRFTSGSTSSGGFTFALTPAHPGDTVVLWGTGGGAGAGKDTRGTSGDQTRGGI